MFTRSSQFLLLVLTLAPAGPSRAQELKWTLKYSGPASRHSTAMTYDAGRMQVVLFGGESASGSGRLSDTWIFEGSAWTQKALASQPSARSGHAMAYDAVRDEVVLFGGFDGTDLNDTWVWNGWYWQQRHPVSSPPARSRHAMAYDGARQQVVLFGGSNRDDTWVWNGANWSQKSPQTIPRARSSHAMAYDSSRGRIVLFGGYWYGGASESAHLADTWEFDGSNWIEQATAIAPPGRSRHAMVFDDANRLVVLFGGGNYDDTWVWNGSSWTQKAPLSKPRGRQGHAMAYDAARRQTVMFGEDTGNRPDQPGFLYNETWIWNGADWSSITVAPRPAARSGHAMVYDSVRGVATMFGGSIYRRGTESVNLPAALQSDTWAWDGVRWYEKTPGYSPPKRFNHAMAYDEARQQVVLFGGNGVAGLLGDTWVWNGFNWTQRTPASSPPPMADHAMAYDVVRGQVVLFGTSSDTWLWDGFNWSRAAIGGLAPQARSGHALVYDGRRGQVILFGGRTSPAIGSTPLGDTWLWDGVQWNPQTLFTSPSSRSEHAVAYNGLRSQVMLFGGGNSYADTWTWDAYYWLLRSTFNTPEGRNDAAMAYDAGRGQVVLFGGYSSYWSEPIDGTWVLDTVGGAGNLGTISVTTNLPSATFVCSGPLSYTGTGTSFIQTGVPVGEYRIVYGAVPGYITPPSETKTLVAGGILTFTGYYQGAASPLASGLVVDPNVLNFSHEMGQSAPAVQTISVSTEPARVYFTTNTFASAWLVVTPSTGFTPARLAVSVDTSRLTPGNYSGTIGIYTPGTFLSPQYVTVRLTVQDRPQLLPLGAALSFSHVIGKAPPSSQPLYLTAKGRQVSYRASAESSGNWLLVSPSSGATPVNLNVSVDTSRLSAGAYSGSLIISSNEAVNSPQTIPVTLTITSDAPQPLISAIACAATGSTGPRAPGSLISISGTNLSAGVAYGSTDPLPEKLNETSVQLNGRPIPLLSVSPSSIKAQLPFEAAPGSGEITVVTNSVSSRAFPISIVSAAPGIVLLDDGSGAIQNEGYSLNGPHNPALAGSVVTVYLTGQGLVYPAVATGACAPESPFSSPLLAVRAAVGDQAAEVVFTGLVPSLVGIAQASIRVPDLAPGAYLLSLSVGGARSNPVMIYVSR